MIMSTLDKAFAGIGIFVVLLIVVGILLAKVGVISGSIENTKTGKKKTFGKTDNK
jgi:hypothetical protein